MSNASYVILRTTSLNGVVIEKDRFFGFVKSLEDGDFKAQKLNDMVYSNTALRGLCFVFYVKKVMEDDTDD